MKFRWADCELDREARALQRAGRSVRVQPLVLDLLLLLLQHRGRVVSEDVLRRQFWSGVQVTDASLRRLVKEARRAIGDDGERQDCIQTVRGHGFRFAAAVTIEDGWDTSFVGRDDVMAGLERKLEEVASGIGGLTLLHGPAGIGKTRTLAEIEARAGVRGFRVLHGSGRAEAEGDAFHPWLDVARELGIDAILPGPPQDRDARDDASQADVRRYARFRAVSKTLAQAARERPILIALDDLQLADRDGLEALRFLAPALVGGRVWILGAYRTGVAPRTEEALRALGALRADTSTQDLALRGLTSAELRLLVRNQLRAEVGAPLAALLSHRAGGNPLFAVEIARSLQAEGLSLEGDPDPEIEAKLAQGIGPLLERRLSALPADALRLLCAASALGSPFDARVVEAAEGIATGASEAALDVCATAGLIEHDRASQWRFTHPLLAEAVYARLGSDAPAQHARIAAACAAAGFSHPFLLAHQFLKARPVVSASDALAHVRAAAREAMARSALADAQLWYRESLALAAESDLAEPEMYELWMESGDASLAVAGVEEARPHFERAARLAQRAADRERLARAALAYAHRPSAVDAHTGVLHWLRAAEATPCDDERLRARIAGRLGSELLYAGVEHAEEARALVVHGVAIARRTGDPATLGPVLLDLSVAEFSPRDTHAWLATLEDVEREGRAAGNLEIEFRGLAARAIGFLELADRDRVESVCEACRAFVRGHLSMYAVAVTRGIEVMLALLDGRWSDARAGIEDFERFLHMSKSVGLALLVGIQRVVLAIEEERIEAILPLLDAIGARHAQLLSVAVFAGHVRAIDGDVEAGRVALARLVAGLPGLPFDRSRLPTLAVAAELAYRVGARDAAAALEPELAPYAATSAVIGNAASTYFGSIEQALGWIAAARGDPRKAVEHFQRALQVHEALRSPPWAARSQRAIEAVRRLRLVRGQP